MHSYDGIPIAEYRLPVLCVIFSVLFIALLAAMLLLACQLWNGVDKKKKQRIKKLKASAVLDEVAANQYAREKRKAKNRRRRTRSDRISYAVIFALGICVATCCLIFGIIFPACDHALKDYIVYTGELTVHQYTRHTSIKLGDGTTVRGGAGLTEQDTYGMVVYAKRSKIALGGQK